MPYIIATVMYPTEIAKDLAETYFEMLKKYPFDRSLGKETIPVAVTTNSRGVKVISVMEAKEEKLNEALTWVGKRMALFIPIKACEYKTRVWSNIVEALDYIGMKLPGQ